MRKSIRSFLKFVLVAAIAVAAGWLLSAATSDKPDLIKLISPIYETLQYISRYYYGKETLDYEKLIDHGIDGLLKGLGDKFSHYISPEMVEEEQIEMQGKYGGLGMEVTWDKDTEAIEVVAPMYGTPAWRAGIKSGDKIVEIDGTPTSEMTFMEAVRNLRGKPGTKVKLKIYREGVKDLLEMEIVREKIVLIPVKYATFESDIGRIGYVKLTKFMESTYEELEKALKEIISENIKVLILDLRDNPGGYLDQAVKVAAIFIDNGIIVKIKSTFADEEVYEVHENKVVMKTTTSTRMFDKVEEQLPKDIEVVVLVNKGSASASEIVTGAIKDHKRGIIVGQKTFGKGSVQTGISLSNGGVLYLTTAHYLTPSGRDIHGQGIEPDYEVTVETEAPRKEEKVLDYTKRRITLAPEKDPYIVKAISVLRERQ